MSSADSSPDPARWVDDHGDALFRYALSRVRDRALAEDLVQDTLLAAMRGIDAYAGASAERTWLIGILRHKLADHFRVAARDRRLWEDDAGVDDRSDDFDEHGRWRSPPVAWSAPESALHQEQFWRVLDACIDGLPEKLRAPFMLRELDGLDTNSLAEMLQVTRNNLWVMLSRARQQLRRCLQRQWFEA